MSTGQGDSSQGSSQDAQAAVVSALQAGAASGTPATPAHQQDPPQAPAAPATPASDPNSLASPFLAKVDPADRSVVEKYVKEWDGGVTKKFEELHGQLKPFQELGADPETLAQAVQLMEFMDSDPQGFLEGLQEALRQSGQQQQQQQQPQGLPGQQQQVGDDPLASLPPQFVEKFQQMESVLEMIAGDFIQQREQRTQQEQDQELDQTLASLKEAHGDFDEDYVLAKMAIGVDPQEAVQAFQALVQQQVNTRSTAPPIPPILGGGGAAPASNNTDITKASNKDVKNLVADILKQQAQT